MAGRYDGNVMIVTGRRDYGPNASVDVMPPLSTLRRT